MTLTVRHDLRCGIRWHKLRTETDGPLTTPLSNTRSILLLAMLSSDTSRSKEECKSCSRTSATDSRTHTPIPSRLLASNTADALAQSRSKRTTGTIPIFCSSATANSATIMLEASGKYPFRRWRSRKNRRSPQHFLMLSIQYSADDSRPAGLFAPHRRSILPGISISGNTSVDRSHQGCEAHVVPPASSATPGHRTCDQTRSCTPSKSWNSLRTFP